MATVEELRLEIKAVVADAVSKLKKFDKQAKTTTKEATKMQTAFAKMRDFMQGPVAGAKSLVSAIKGVASSLDSLIMASAEAEKSQAILRNTLESTGANAWTSMSKLNEFAETMHRTTLFEDDAVSSMQAVLLGFRNIQGVNFDRASESILDMAQVMGMDLTSAAQAVGKALDNPIKGLDSLSKQGFKFSDAEKEVIKRLVETNQLAAAQDIILKELSKTFGGSAAAAAATATGGYEQMKKAFGDMSEGYGNLLKLLASSKAGKSFTGFASDFADASDRIGKNKVIDKIATDMITKIPKASQVMAALTAANVDYEYALNSITYKVAELNNELKGTTEGPAGQKRRYELEGEIAAYRRLLSIMKSAEEVKADAAKAANKDAQRVAAQEAYNKKLAEEKQLLVDVNIEYAKQFSSAYSASNQIAEEDAQIQNLQTMIALYGDLSSAMSAAYSTSVEKSPGEEAALEKEKERIAMIEALKDATVSAASTMAEAFGAALVAGEDGWAAFGKAGLNAIAAVIEALAKQWMVSGLAALVPGIGFNPAAAVGYLAAASAAYVAAGAIKAIPMAEGGEGIVTKPTLFLAGEKGPEPYAFGGANNKRGMGKTEIHYHVAGSLLYEKQLSARMRGAIAYAGRDY